MRALAALAGALGLMLLAGGAGACDGRGAPCEAGEGSYRLILPEGAAAKVPAVIYLHGWGGNPDAVLRNAALREAVAARGMALIVPEGVPRAGRTQRDWAVRDGQPHPRDDLAFLRAVIADAATRGVDAAQVLLAGFSRGGSFVWDVACHAPDFARAYAPISGAFWEPLPQDCAGPVALLHAHGWTDRVVPIEGRPLGGGRLIQGDVFASLAILRRALGCEALQPQSAPMDGPLWYRNWTDCAAGQIVLILHPGGHVAPPGWAAKALDWFEERRRQPPPLTLARQPEPDCAGVC